MVAVLRLRLHTPRNPSKAAKAAIKCPLYASFERDAPPALRATPLRAGEAGSASGKDVVILRTLAITPAQARE